MCVCVCARARKLLILQHAGHKCVMSAGMFDLCYLSDEENYSLQMQSVTGKDSAASVCVCASSRSIVHVFMQCLCMWTGCLEPQTCKSL